MKWLVLEGDDGWRIILPNHDIKPHAHIKKGQRKAEVAWENCPCKPKINVGEKLIVHNSFKDAERIDEAMIAFNST